MGDGSVSPGKQREEEVSRKSLPPTRPEGTWEAEALGCVSVLRNGRSRKKKAQVVQGTVSWAIT